MGLNDIVKFIIYKGKYTIKKVLNEKVLMIDYRGNYFIANKDKLEVIK